MLIKSNGGADFKELGRRLRAAGPRGGMLRKAITKELNALAKPLVDEIKSEVTNLKVKGSRGGGARARGRFDDAKDARRLARAAARGAAARRRRASGGTGLRARVARGVRSRVSWSGFRYGLQVRVDPTSLPQSQRTLPKHLNNPRGWRHPVFGDRRTWEQQFGGPYFDRPVARHAAKMRAGVQRTVEQYLRRLQ